MFGNSKSNILYSGVKEDTGRRATENIRMGNPNQMLESADAVKRVQSHQYTNQNYGMLLSQ